MRFIPAELAAEKPGHEDAPKERLNKPDAPALRSVQKGVEPEIQEKKEAVREQKSESGTKKHRSGGGGGFITFASMTAVAVSVAAVLLSLWGGTQNDSDEIIHLVAEQKAYIDANRTAIAALETRIEKSSGHLADAAAIFVDSTSSEELLNAIGEHLAELGSVTTELQAGQAALQAGVSRFEGVSVRLGALERQHDSTAREFREIRDELAAMQDLIVIDSGNGSVSSTNSHRTDSVNESGIEIVALSATNVFVRDVSSREQLLLRVGDRVGHCGELTAINTHAQAITTSGCGVVAR